MKTEKQFVISESILITTINLLNKAIHPNQTHEGVKGFIAVLSGLPVWEEKKEEPKEEKADTKEIKNGK